MGSSLSKLPSELDSDKSSTLLIEGLDPAITERDLRHIFSVGSAICAARIYAHRRALIDFDGPETAEQIRRLSPITIRGKEYRPVVCKRTGVIRKHTVNVDVRPPPRSTSLPSQRATSRSASSNLALNSTISSSSNSSEPTSSHSNRSALSSSSRTSSARPISAVSSSGPSSTVSKPKLSCSKKLSARQTSLPSMSNSKSTSVRPVPTLSPLLNSKPSISNVMPGRPATSSKLTNQSPPTRPQQLAPETPKHSDLKANFEEASNSKNEPTKHEEKETSTEKEEAENESVCEKKEQASDVVFSSNVDCILDNVRRLFIDKTQLREECDRLTAEKEKLQEKLHILGAINDSLLEKEKFLVDEKEAMKEREREWEEEKERMASELKSYEMILKDLDPSSTHTPSPQSSSVINGDECCLCLERAPSYAIINCGHVCLCEVCAEEWREAEQNHCPVCRKPIDRLLKLYF